MTPQMGTLLVDEVVPRLRAAVSSVPAVGSDDNEELLADMTANAAKMIDSAERAGKKFSSGNIAYFASRARSGRRSTGGSRTDVHAPGTQLDGRAHHEHLDGAQDTPAHCSELGDTPDGLHEILGSGADTDPAEEAARNLDWEQFLAEHPPRHRTAVMVLAGGGTMREAGRQCGIGDSAALLLRRRIAADLLAFFGEKMIRRLLSGMQPGWSSNLRAGRERHLCHSLHREERRPA